MYMADENFMAMHYLLHCITAGSPHFIRILIIMKQAQTGFFSLELFVNFPLSFIYIESNFKSLL